MAIRSLRYEGDEILKKNSRKIEVIDEVADDFEKIL